MTDRGVSVRVPDERLDRIEDFVRGLRIEDGTVEQPPGEGRDRLVADLAALVADLRAARADNQRLREFVVAHTLVDKGIVDFDLHADAVERFRRASDEVADVIRAALAEEPRA